MRARFIRSNRKARGFNGSSASSVTFDNADVPKWLRNTAAVAVALVVLVVGFTIVQGGDETSNDVLLTTAPDFSLGSCFDSSPELWLDTATLADCYGPHTSEVVGVADLSVLFTEYPDPSELRRVAERQCAIDLSERTNIPSDSGLSIGASLPTATDWVNGQRLVLCSLSSASGSLLTLPIDLS